jgi:3-oxoacyl-[acyl-carrier-protein] synthase-3
MEKSVGLISMGSYIPAKEILGEKKDKLVKFLREKTLLKKEYIDMIDSTEKLPGEIITNFDGWEKEPWFETWVSKLPSRKRDEDPFSGTKERRFVPMDPDSLKDSIVPHPMLASDAETLSGAMAILNSDIDADDIDLIMAHSQVPDLSIPANVSLIQHKLNLKNAGAYSVDTCCSSFVTMIEIATALIKTGIKKNILIVASYIGSHINDKSSYYSPAIGDASIAAIISEVEDGFGYISSHATSHGGRHDAIIGHNREPNLIKKTRHSPNYTQEFATFYNPVAIKEMAEYALDDINEVVEKALEKAKINISEVDFFVSHQPSNWAGNAWREKIGIPEEKFYEQYEKYANIANCSAANNLLEALEKGLIKENDTVLIASPGAGENHIALLHKVNHRLVKNVRN